MLLWIRYHLSDKGCNMRQRHFVCQISEVHCLSSPSISFLLFHLSPFVLPPLPPFPSFPPPTVYTHEANRFLTDWPRRWRLTVLRKRLNRRRRRGSSSSGRMKRRCSSRDNWSSEIQRLHSVCTLLLWPLQKTHKCIHIETLYQLCI